MEQDMKTRFDRTMPVAFAGKAVGGV